MNNYRIFNFFFSLFFSLSITSCAQKKSTEISDKVFPDGQYTQSVQLSIKTPEGIKGIPFTSLSKINNGNFQIMGLTPFGTKAFIAKGHVDKPEAIQLKFFMTVPKFLNKKFVSSTLHTIQKLQKLTKDQLIKRDGFAEFKTEEYRLQIFSYTKNGVPKEMKLSSSPWTAHIATSVFKRKK